MTFGKNMKRRREELGLTQTQLAERSGVAQSAISSLERTPREPKLTTAIAIARGLDTTVEELSAEEEEEEQAA